MRPSPPDPSWSFTHSRSQSSTTQDNLSPPTPGSYFSDPAPTIVSQDDFALQIDVQLDALATSPHKPSLAHLPHPPLPSPKPRLSGEDSSKMEVLLRNAGRWGNAFDRFESSTPLRPRNVPRVLPSLRDSASDDFSWEATHSALLDPGDLSDPSRCSLLIHEVSLLVGLTGDDDHLSSDDGCPPLTDPPKQVHDILPLNLSPTKSLASRKPGNSVLPLPTNTNVLAHPTNVSVPPSIDPHVDTASLSRFPRRHTPLGSTNPATPIPRYKSADAARQSLSPRRRQGQVFESPLGSASRRNAVDLDEMFSYPREPPPRPRPNPPADRCSLDRLESSLQKLQAHAPGNHRKSRSEGRPSDHVMQGKDKRPSLPPPSLKQQRASHGIAARSPPRVVHDGHFSGPLAPAPRPILPQYVAQRSCPAVSLADDPFEEEHTPNSFMDMDVPVAETRPKQRASSRNLKSKEKVKSLANVAKRVSRGVMAWGKNLTGHTKPGAAK